MNTVKMGALALLSLCVTACNDFVQNIDQPINSVSDELLNSQQQVPFVITGVQGRFAKTVDQLTVDASALSDELVFDANVPGATYIQYAELEQGDITLFNTAVENTMSSLGQLRLYADTLVSRVGKISFTSDSIRKAALFNGYLYGGIARYFWAAYFGLEPERGGGVINKGPFIPSDAMYAQAVEKLNLALANVVGGPDQPAEYYTRVVNSLLARIYLFQGNYTQAEAAAQKGMTSGDAPFGARFSTESNNEWWASAGVGRSQLVVDNRFYQYQKDDPKEATRLPLISIVDTTYFVQGKYPDQASFLPFMTWEENELMLAEVEVRNNNAASALTRVNDVRAVSGLDPLASIDLEGMYTERDKQLFATGTRLIDQRRFNHWHLPEGSWKFLPITEDERNANPNLH